MAQPLQLSADMRGLVDRVGKAVQRVDPHEICTQVKVALQDLAWNGAAGIPEDLFRANPDGYARRLIHRCPDNDYSIMLMVWQPGQGTPIHDHAGRWCVECVVRGQIQVTSYDMKPTSDPALFRFTQIEQHMDDTGDVGILVPPNEHHRIGNLGDVPAATMHVYQGEMLWCHSFQPAADGLYRRERCDLAYSQ